MTEFSIRFVILDVGNLGLLVMRDGQNSTQVGTIDNMM